MQNKTYVWYTLSGRASSHVLQEWIYLFLKLHIQSIMIDPIKATISS